MDRAAAERKLDALIEHLKAGGPVLVAFSGGVDSSLLLAAAREALGGAVVAATAASSVHAEWERLQAAEIAGALGVRHVVFPSRELELEAFRVNDAERCYHCKRSLFGQLAEIAAHEGLTHVVHGANADDLADYRPGLSAAEEAGVSAPLVQVGLSKAEIRFLAASLGLPNWNQPAMACFATRIAYGEEVTTEKLRRVERAEAYLAEHGFSQARVRCHGSVARVETQKESLPIFLQEEFAAGLVARLRSLGFSHVCVDLEGYVPGKMNRELRGKAGALHP